MPITQLLTKLIATLLALSANPTDLKRETVDERNARLTMAAEVFVKVADEATCGGAHPPGCTRQWSGKRADLVFAFVGVAVHESGFANYVATGHCEDGPKDARCDNGKARTYLQVHQEVCSVAWVAAPGSREELEAATWCAVRIFKASARICSESDGHGIVVRKATWSDIFAKYAGQQCKAAVGASVEITKIAIEQLFQKQRIYTSAETAENPAGSERTAEVYAPR